MGLKKNNPGCGCCDENVACSACAGSGNNAPSTFTVEISGMADDGCNQCSIFNGTWILPVDPGNSCRWYVASPEMCGYDTMVNLNVADNEELTGWWVRLYVAENLSLIYYTSFKLDTSPSNPDCLNTIALDIPFEENDILGQCDGSGATVEVTSGG